MNRTIFLASLKIFAACALLQSQNVFSQDAPLPPMIRMIVPFTPGASNDVSVTPRMVALFAQEASEPSNMTAKEFAAHVDQELDKWQKLARARGIRNSD